MQRLRRVFCANLKTAKAVFKFYRCLHCVALAKQVPLGGIEPSLAA